MRLSVPALLLIAALALAPWLGGRFWLEAQPGDGVVSLANLLIDRTEAGWSQVILAGLVLGCAVWAGVSRSVLQVPSQRILGAMFLCWMFLALAVISSQHKHASLLEFARWTCMLFALVGATAVLGRERGARLAVGAIVLGASVAALTGISEFIEASRYSPNWRIFAGWQNPNAAAGMFALALPLVAGFVISAQERTEKLLSFLAFAVVGCALWLTASKGGLLAALVGLVTFGLFVTIGRVGKQLIVVGVACAICVAFTLGISKLADVSGGTGAVAGSRLAASGAESSQSFEFRKRLWADSLKLATENPVVGVGPGAFAYGIKKVSSTQGSAVAHNGFLQLAAESGVFAGVSLLLALLLWCGIVVKRHPGMPERSNILRCAVIGSVAAGVAGTLIESSFSYLGWAVCFFALLGIGLLLAVDGVVPERAPVSSRVMGLVVVSIGAFAYLLIGALGDGSTRVGLEAMRDGNAEAAIQNLQRAKRTAGADPAPHMQLARLYIALGEADKAIESARAAVHLGPSAIRYGVLGDAYAKAGKNNQAADAFATGSTLDPNNPAPLRRQFEFLQSIGDDLALDVGRRLVAMEKSDFYKLSAIPWLVPTDSIGAREFLASKGSKAEAAQLLEGAAEILRHYRNRTVPELRRLTGLQSYDDAVSALKTELGREPNQVELAEKLGMTQNQLYDWLSERKEHRIAGESIAEAEEKTQKLREILHTLAGIYRSSGKAFEASALEAEADGLK